MTVLLKRFLLNGHTIGFHPQTRKLKLHTKQIIPGESPAEEVSVEWSHHRISSTDIVKLKLCTKLMAPCESTAEEVSFKWSHYRNRSLALRGHVTNASFKQ